MIELMNNYISIKNSNIYRGYTPLGKELTNNQYDWHECVDFGPNLNQNDPKEINTNQLLGPNQWPEKPYDLKKLLEIHWAYMITLGKKITQGLSISLGLYQSLYFLSIIVEILSNCFVVRLNPSFRLILNWEKSPVINCLVNSWFISNIFTKVLNLLLS